MFFSRIIPAIMIALGLMSLPASSDTLSAPNGPVLLSVSGSIASTNAEGRADFDLDMLRALGESEIVTDTIWTPGTHRFTGVRLKDLLDHLGATGGSIEATAINDYSVTIPVSDATAQGPIIAYEMDGEPLPRRGKGPLWVVYPYALSRDYRTEVVYSRSAWQLKEITIKE